MELDNACNVAGRKRKGATAVAYAPMVTLIAAAIVATVTASGLALPDLFQPEADPNAPSPRDHPTPAFPARSTPTT